MYGLQITWRGKPNETRGWYATKEAVLALAAITAQQLRNEGHTVNDCSLSEEEWAEYEKPETLPLGYLAQILDPITEDELGTITVLDDQRGERPWTVWERMPETDAKQIGPPLYRCVVPGGWLVVGAGQTFIPDPHHNW